MDASGRMKKPPRPRNGRKLLAEYPWWRMRAFETQAERTGDVSGGLRALMERMLAQRGLKATHGSAKNSPCCWPGATRPKPAKTLNRRMTVPFTPRCTREDYACANFAAVHLSLPMTLSVCPQGELCARFSRRACEAMILGMIHTNTMAFASVIPGTLQASAATPTRRIRPRFAFLRHQSAGQYMRPRQRCADGRPFAGLETTISK
ncbi:MAG: hypothetical protein ACLUI3_10595 [Christensenellales bacterium]